MIDMEVDFSYVLLQGNDGIVVQGQTYRAGDFVYVEPRLVQSRLNLKSNILYVWDGALPHLSLHSQE